MGAIHRKWTGAEWQAHVTLLLLRHYGATEYQPVPDLDRGDAGIEGFAKCGHAYQCYAAQDPLSTQALYENQRDKMSADIAKFVNNKAKLSKLFGGLTISRWVFMVPTHSSKELIAHAAKKAAEVRKASLAYVAKDFDIIIQDDSAFAVEREQLVKAGLAQVSLVPQSIDPAEISQFATNNSALIANLERKLGVVAANKSIAEGRRMFLEKYLAGRRLADELRQGYPDIHENVLTVKRLSEANLESRQYLGEQLTILNEQRALVSRFRESLNMSEDAAVAVAWEAVADWLLRCPLEFK